MHATLPSSVGLARDKSVFIRCSCDSLARKWNLGNNESPSQTCKGMQQQIKENLAPRNCAQLRLVTFCTKDAHKGPLLLFTCPLTFEKKIYIHNRSLRAKISMNHEFRFVILGCFDKIATQMTMTWSCIRIQDSILLQHWICKRIYCSQENMKWYDLLLPSLMKLDYNPKNIWKFAQKR